MLKKFLSIILIFIIIMFTIYSSSYGAIQPVNKESLEQEFKELFETDFFKDNTYKISGIEVKDDSIVINTEEMGQVPIKYNLDDEPTFTTEVTMSEGMNYNEYSNEGNKSIFYMYPYIAIASLNGMTPEYAFAYISLIYLSLSMQQQPEEIKGVDTDELLGNLMYYMDIMYGEPSIISDADEGNTFEIYTEKEDIDDTSCKIVTTLKIKADADFARLQEMMEEQFSNQEQDPPEEVVEEPQEEHEETPVITNNNSSSNNNNNNNNNNIQKTTTTNNLPKAGENTKLYFLIGLIVILVIFFGINYIRLKDVK